MQTSLSPGFGGGLAETCSRRASARSKQLRWGLHTPSFGRLLQVCPPHGNGRGQDCRWEGAGTPSSPCWQRKPPGQAQSRSGRTWQGDFSKGVDRGWGEWALDTTHLPAEEINSLTKGHQHLGAWVLTRPHSSVCLSRAPAHRESKIYRIVRACRPVGKQRVKESKEKLRF